MKEIIIYQPWGGLGDNLAHTPIPELCHNKGIKCYLSNQNSCRNQEIYDLVWSKNPYISGTRDSMDMSWLDVPIIRESNREWNEVKNIQRRHGFEPIHHYPILYTDKPILLKEFINATVVDLAAFSLYQNYSRFINASNYNKMFNILTTTYNLDNFININHKAVYTSTPKIMTLDNSSTHSVECLKDYCNIIFSCKNYICANSGNAVLASTIKHTYNTNTNIYVFNVECLTPPSSFQGLIFKNTNYITIDTGRILTNI